MSKKPRILCIATLPPPVHGSAVVSQQIKDSKIINEAFVCDFVNLSTSRKMDEIGKKNFAKIWRIFSALFLEFWKLLTHRYDFCYISLTCHGSGFLKDSLYALLCKLFRRKLVIHQHNKGMSDDVERWPYRWLLPMVYKNAKVILLSWKLYPDISNVVGRDNVVICPNGIKIEYDKIKENKQAFENKIPHILFLSNLIESKGVYILLDALKLLQDKNIPFICDMIGGETKEINEIVLMKEIKARGLEQFVVYHGKKYGDEKEESFDKSDVFVHPTYNDCFPLVLLEAMQHGIPCVTTDIGGIGDIVENGQTGFVCEPKNPVALADALACVLQNEELRTRMGEAGRNRLIEHFSESVFEERLKTIFMETVSI